MKLPVILLLATLPLAAQQGRPGGGAAVVGYVYPAGARAGTETEITVGGMALGGTRSVSFSGGDLPVTILKHHQPINNLLENKIRDLIKAEREKLAKTAKEETTPDRKPRPRRYIKDEELVHSVCAREGISEDDANAFIESIQQKRDPKRQINAQLAERLTLRVKIPADAPRGRRELRLLGPNGLSNPLAFIIGDLPEITETDPNDTPALATVPIQLPAVLNGRILPGDVDCFSFDAPKDMRLTAAVAARELTPYLADAVPGWFQAGLVLLDKDGREVAFNGSFDHRPDPLLCATLPAAGRYTLEIRDSLCRGREDFVYRITAGEIPCLTEQFPLGGKTGTKVPVRVSGWNLADYQSAVAVGDQSGQRQIPLRSPILGFLQFEASPYTDFIETDADDASPNAWELNFPCTINGIIRKPGQRDRYSLRLKSGDSVVAEVRARRLGSPLDSNLTITGPDHKPVATNDDCDDPTSGLLTHHADSRVAFTATSAGIYQFEIRDTQGRGSRGHAYRLTLAPPQPDFALRVTPSALNARAGSMVPCSVRIVRRDGFDGEVDLALTDPPPGYSLLGGKIPKGADSVQCSLRLPNDAAPGIHPLSLAGTAVIGGAPVTRPAQAADDRMQAFFYRHLVPASQLLACVTARPNNPNAGKGAASAFDRLRPLCAKGIALAPGGTTTMIIPHPQGPQAPELVFSLLNPPAGITLTAKSEAQSTTLVFAASAATKPGALGNLIVQVAAIRNPNKDKPKGKPRPFPIGSLPPIPCTVTPKMP